MIPSTLPLAALLTLFSTVAAAPNLSYPFSVQNPPVARYGQTFSYQVPSDTFTSGSSIQYSADNLPSWLSFDNSTRTLYGTAPSGSDDQTLTFNLTATDDSGSSSESCSLVLTNNAGPEVNPNTNITAVLQTAGAVAGDGSLVLTPGEQFSFSFPDDFFLAQSSRPILYYAGISAGHTPLPIWLHFDSSNKQFTGTAPSVNSQIAPAESFNVLYLVSDYSAFTSSDVAFNILVGAHQFTTNITTDVVSVNTGAEFEYGIPLQDLTLDGAPLKLANISSITTNGTISWLTVNQNNASISGTAPSDMENNSQNVIITVQDSYGDQVSYMLSLEFSGTNDTIFTSTSLDPVNATSGQYFEYSISKFINDKTGVTINVHYDPNVDWLSYHSDNYTFNGTPPDDFEGTTVTLDATTSDSSSNSKRADTVDLVKRATETAVFQIENYKSAVTSSATSSASATKTSATASSTASSTDAGAAEASATGNSDTGKTLHPFSSKKTAILLGVLIPCLFLIAAFFLWCCFCGNRKKRSKSRKSGDGMDDERLKISRPILPVSTTDAEKTIGMMNAGTAPRPPGSPGSSSTDMEEFVTGEKGVDEWESSPKRVSHFNYMKMDDDGEENDTSYHSEKTHGYNSSTDSTDIQIPPSAATRGDGNRATATTAHQQSNSNMAQAGHFKNDNNQAVGQAIAIDAPSTTTTTATIGGRKAIPAYLTAPYKANENTNSNLPQKVRARNSWRQTDGSDKRWQEHESLGSIGTISTDELLTLRLVDRDSYGDSAKQPGAKYSGDRSTFMQPTQSTILTPHHSIQPSDASSGIIQQLGVHSRDSSLAGHSHSTSIGSYSSSGESQRLHTSSQSNNLQSVSEEHRDVSAAATPVYANGQVYARDPDSTYQYDANSFERSEEDDTSAYRTAESGEEFGEQHGETSDDEIRPYRNSHGELLWSQVEGQETQRGHAYSSSDEAPATSTAQDPKRKVSSASTHDSKRDTVRLVDFTKARRGSGPTSPKASMVATQHPVPVPRIPAEKSVSAELAFI